MPLMIHDTLQRKKVAFAARPGDGPITLYVCGPTVYSYAHIGNARPVVVFDVLQRLLRRLYPERGVVYARNVTDVDDKINAAALKEGVPIGVVAERFAAIYREDMAALGAALPDHEPRATAHVPAMISQIERLIAAGAAYAAEGHVLFRVSAYPDYGVLSGRSLDDMIAGARVEVAPYKEHPADFVLWKPSKAGDPAWPSPWGEGRPGWHIECSAMIEETLGFPVDLHGGGHDLIFPHHENESAQGVCCTGAASPEGYARYWMHNGFLTMDAEKMSKSLGNVATVRSLLADHPGEVLRWALLSAHYRAPLDWTDALLERSRKALDRLYGVLQDAGRVLGEAAGEAHPKMADGVLDWLQDDLNTPGALSVLFATADRLREAVSARDLDGVRTARRVLLAEADALGLLQGDPDAWFQGAATADLAAQVEGLIAARASARAAKDWPAADRIRAELAALNVEVMDGPGGSATWRLKG
jgi:cysteinyl-tRNA synthetase